MKKILLPYVLIPAVILALVTVLRAWLEVQDPDGAATRLVSANGLSMLWLIGMPAVMLKKGLSLGHGVLVGVLFLVLYRLPIGVVYALAWSGKWTVAGTGAAVRYVAQSQPAAGAPEPSVFGLLLGNTLVPVLPGLVILLVFWAITWAVGFRGKRPFAGAPRDVA